MLFYLFAWTSKLYESPILLRTKSKIDFSAMPQTPIFCQWTSFLQKWWMYKLQLSSSEHSICQTGFLRFTYRKRHFLSTDNEYGWAIKHLSFKVYSQRKPMNPVHSVTSLNRPLSTNSQNKQLTLTLWTDSDLAGWTLLSSLLLLKLAGGCWTFYILHKKILCFF